MAWHGSCYRKRLDDNYPIVFLPGYDMEIDDPGEKDKYVKARNGDHLICPFQCDLCHFRNVQKRNPQMNSERDKRALTAIRRANLDAFWGRAEGTVDNNRREIKRAITLAEDRFGLWNFLPPMGPHRVSDDWGMSVAMLMIERSMSKGKYGNNLQFETTRKLRSGFSNLWGASRHTMTTSVMAKDQAKLFVTRCPTYSMWFERFVKGMHSRMGDDRRPDAALSTDMMREIMIRVESDFQEAEDNQIKRFICRAAVFFLGAFLGSLRGEEVPRILRRDFIQLNIESSKWKIPHCVLPLFGRFKGDQGIPRCYLFRICNKSKSGLNFERWVKRLSNFERNSSTQFLFSDNKGRKESGKNYEPFLISKLKAVQKETNGIVPKGIEVEELFGVSRSFRRGSVAAASNAPNDECNEDDINRNNRWRKEDRAGTRNASLSMVQVYTDTLQAIEADLRFSTCQ
jgi:hypothetical protein